MTSTTITNQIGSVSFETVVANIPVHTDYTTIAEFRLDGMTPHGTIKIDNTGATAFSNLKIQKQIAPNDDWTDWIEGADFVALASATSRAITEISTGFSETLAGGASQTL